MFNTVQISFIISVLSALLTSYCEPGEKNPAAFQLKQR